MGDENILEFKNCDDCTTPNILKPTKSVCFKRVNFLGCELHPHFKKCSPLGEKKLEAQERAKVSQQSEGLTTGLPGRGRPHAGVSAPPPRPASCKLAVLGGEGAAPQQGPLVCRSNARLCEPW